MTQFQPPPPPPPYPAYGAYEMQAPPKWSAAAISGFVCSLLGFLGITAILGLVLGVVGIISTSGGRRRGLGLAIAAIPISLLTGAICAFLILGAVMLARVAQVPTMIKSVMALDSGDLKTATAELRNITTTDLNAAVTPEQMEGWFRKVKNDYGTLTTLKFDQTTNAPQKLSNGGLRIDLDGKFVNGPATVSVSVRMEGGLHFRIDDITVGKSSLRDAGGTPLKN